MSIQILAPRIAAAVRLTDRQLAAAQPAEGAHVVVGGPGTGKTTVAAAAAVARVRSGSSLERTVVLAHSRSAAQTLRRDITRQLDQAQTSAQVTTVHGLALGLMRRYQPHDEAPWLLLRAPEQEARIRELIAGMPPGIWPQELREAVGTRAFARQLRDVLARTRQFSLDPEDLARLGSQAHDHAFVSAARFMEEYLVVGDFSGHLDYAELVYRARLLVREPAVREAIRASFDAIILDDAQELDPAQGGLIADLAQIGLPLLALGDPHQSIGWFRGASPTALRDLTDATAAQVVRLEQGFRVHEQPAAALTRLGVRLGARDAAPTPSPAGDGGRVAVRVFDDTSAELAQVAAELRHAVTHDGLAWRDLAVILRAGRAELSLVSRELVRLGIPVEVEGDEIALSEQPVVATLLLALGAAARRGPLGQEEARQLLASPLVGLDSVAQRQLGRALAQAHPGEGISTALVARAVSEPALLDGIEGPAADAVREFSALLTAVGAKVAADAEVQVALWELWAGTEWPEQLRTRALRGSHRADADLDALVELFESAARAQDLRGAVGVATFLTEISEQEIPADTGRELSPEARGVRVMTAHRTRGLEWERVWIVGVQEGAWPRSSRTGLLLDAQRVTPAVLLPADPLAHLRSERQLFLVACSRARSGLSVSAVQGIDGEGGKPSRFLGELGGQIEHVSGRPEMLLSASALVGDLRRTLTDESAPPGLRRAAAARLAQLASVTTPDGVPSFPGAATGSWWFQGDLTSSAPPLTGPIAITGSSLETLLECPRRWFLARKAKAEGSTNSRASVGDVVHLIASTAAREDLDADQMRSHLDAVWQDIGFEAEWLSATERVEIDAALDRFAAYQSSQSGELLAVEQPFTVNLDVDGTQVALVGTVDRLERDEDGRLRVVDLKTARKALRPSEVLDHAQLGVYQLAASLGAFDHLAPGERRVAPPTLAFLRAGNVFPELVAQPSIDEQPALKDQELSVGPTWVHDKLASAVGVLKAGSFEAVECRSCRFCQFRASCPVIQQGDPS